MAGVRLKTINVDVRPTRSELPTSLGNTVSQKKRALFALLSVNGGGCFAITRQKRITRQLFGQKGPFSCRNWHLPILAFSHRKWQFWHIWAHIYINARSPLIFWVRTVFFWDNSASRMSNDAPSTIWRSSFTLNKPLPNGDAPRSCIPSKASVQTNKIKIDRGN